MLGQLYFKKRVDCFSVGTPKIHAHTHPPTHPSAHPPTHRPPTHACLAVRASPNLAHAPLVSPLCPLVSPLLQATNSSGQQIEAVATSCRMPTAELGNAQAYSNGGERWGRLLWTLFDETSGKCAVKGGRNQATAATACIGYADQHQLEKKTKQANKSHQCWH